MPYLITAKCDNNHTQELRIDDSLGLTWAEGWAGLMDGTSKFYVYSPIGTDSVIGKCGICRAQIHCTVTEENDERR